jgi:hypothetical protein
MTVISFPPSPPRTIESPQSSAVHLDELARRAYSFGFPLVMMDMAREAMQSGEGDAQALAVPVLHRESASSPLSSELAEMQPCTVFACAWLDLCREPVVVSAPDTAGRHYAAHALDAWSDVCASFGARTNAGRSRNYALVGPLWQGRLPDGVVKLRANTSIAWLQIRLHASDMRDRSAACSLLDRFRLSRLSDWGESSQPQIFKLARTPEGVADGVMALPACEFYQRLCALMVDNSPSTEDLEIMTELRLLGIERTRSSISAAFRGARRRRSAPAWRISANASWSGLAVSRLCAGSMGGELCATRAASATTTIAAPIWLSRGCVPATRPTALQRSRASTTAAKRCAAPAHTSWRSARTIFRRRMRSGR